MAQTVDTLQVQFEAVGSNFERSINRLFGRGGVMVTAVAGAAAAAGVAIAGFSAKGLKDFTDLDTGMREVFTLLPGITEDAMGEMTDHVRDFATDFGRLPDEVVPALYQALSAGVPADNVFSFLETANAAARGGVTDLETAVDGLTSVINAYGADIMTADDASDALFTAVRLGKTDFEQLSDVISRVTVPAAAAGIEFDTVTAALAAMTAQGTPTAEAATQLRGVINELTKEGSAAYDMFEAITGESFPDFVAGGGTLDEALTILADHTNANGGRINDAFGSIEAGMGALTLTSESGSQLFQNALDEMSTKAGATDEAFQMMDGGIQASWDRLKAGFAVLSTEVGEKLAPMFQGAVDTIVTDIFPRFRDFVLGVFTAIADTTAWLSEQWTAFQTDTEGTYAVIRTTLESFGAAVALVFEALGALWTNVLKPVWDAIQPYVQILWDAVTGIIEGAIEAIKGVLNILIGFLEGDWDRAWEGAKQLLDGVWSAAESVVQAAWNTIRAVLDSVIAYVEGTYRPAWDALTGFFSGLWDDIKAGAASGWSGIVEAIQNAISGITDFFSGIWNNVVGSVKSAVNEVISFVNKLIDAWNSLSFSGGGQVIVPGVTVKGVEIIPEVRVPSFSFGVPPIGNIPMLEAGGIVTGATLAMIGEAGAEAVIPLDRLDGMMGSQTIIVELDGRVLTRAVAPRMVQEARIRTGLIGL